MRVEWFVVQVQTEFRQDQQSVPFLFAIFAFKYFPYILSQPPCYTTHGFQGWVAFPMFDPSEMGFANAAAFRQSFNGKLLFFSNHADVVHNITS